MVRDPARVLIFAMAFPPEAVGSGMYAHRLACGLAGRGCRVRVLAPAGQGNDWQAFDARQPYVAERIVVPAFVPWQYPLVGRQLRRAVATYTPHVLWTTNGMATRLVGWTSQLDGRNPPIISCMRGSDITTRLPGRGPWSWLESVYQRRCYARSAAIAAASEYLKRVAVSKGVDAARIFVNPSAFDFAALDTYRYDPERLRAAHPELGGRRVVLTVARLVRQKRVHVLIDALARLRERFPDLLLVVAGHGPELPVLRRRAAALGVVDRVVLVGPVPPMSAALYDLYSRADVFAMAGVREGMSNVFMEAGALGRASVGAADGGIPEVIQVASTGLLARADDPADFARCLQELLDDPARAQAMGNQARQWVRARFSVDALVARSYAVLQQVVGRELAP